MNYRARMKEESELLAIEEDIEVAIRHKVPQRAE